MILFDNHQINAFEEFCIENKKYWGSVRPAREAEPYRYVVVELIHNHANLLMMNILVAKYIASIIGAEVLGVTANRFLQYSVPVNAISRLGESYGLRAVVNIDRLAIPADEATIAQRNTDYWRIMAQEGAALRQAILEYQLRGVHVGDLMYDTYLRITSLPTIERLDDRFADVFARASSLADRYSYLFEKLNVVCTVISHDVYNDYGLLLRCSLKHGVPVYQKGASGTSEVRILRYDEPKDLGVAFGEVSKDDLSHMRRSLGAAFSRTAETYFPPSARMQEHLDYLRFSYGKNKEFRTREELVEMLRLDPKKRTAAVLPHMFTDSPHYSQSCDVFDDYYQWMKNTLEVAQTITNVNWIVRQHPYEATMGLNGPFKELAERYVIPSSHMRVVPQEISTGSLFSCTDIVVTVSGTAGVEFASAGIPCITAGNSFYAGLDFVRRARSEGEYRGFLAEIADIAQPLGTDEIQQAKEAALIYFHYRGVPSSFLPPTHDLAGVDWGLPDVNRFWNDAVARLSALVEDDPLFRAITDMIRSGRRELICPDLSSTLAIFGVSIQP